MPIPANNRPPAVRVDPVPKLVFFHISKTAGSSLRKVFQASFGHEWCSEPFPQAYLTEADAQYFGQHHVICGHISRADQRKWYPDRSFFTMLRDPLQRCLSWLDYVLTLEDKPNAPPIVHIAKQLPIMEFIETVEARDNLYNTMTRQLGSHLKDDPANLGECLDRAKYTLEKCLWIGRAEAFDEDVAYLGKVLGRDLISIRDNVRPKRTPIAEWPPRLVSRLQEMIEYDNRIWNWTHWELFGGRNQVLTPLSKRKKSKKKKKR